MAKLIRGRGWWGSAGLLVGVFAGALVTIARPASARADEGSGNGPVDPFFGSFGAAVEIDVPSYHGFEPRLALHYNSQLGNGRAGVGWSLSGFATVERASPGKGAPRYDASDTFLLDGQELIPCTNLGGTHCTRIQSYKRIKWDAAANTWTVWDKDGTRLSFTSVHSTSKGTFRWAMTSAVDTRGNAISYGFWCDGGNDCYPSSVTYNGNAINLYWEPRPDAFTFATGAGLGSTAYRLKTVDVLAHGARARSYKLAYAVSPTSARSTLASVQRFGSDATLDGTWTVTGGSALPAQTFGFSWSTPGAYSKSYASTGSNSDWDAARTWSGDFDGDGKADRVSYWGGIAVAQSFISFFSNGNGTYRKVYGSTGSNADWDAARTWSGDFNGDGKTDLVSYYGGNGVSRSFVTFLSNGDGTFQKIFSTTGSNSDWNADRIWVGDVNGDGKTDLVSYYGGIGVAQSFITFLSNGDGTFRKVYSSTGSNSDWDAARTWSGDLDGDGRMDLVSYWGGAGASRSFIAFLSNGDGSFRKVYSSTGSNGDWDASRTWLGDFNGDGKADLVSYYGGNGVAASFITFLSNGDGSFRKSYSSTGSNSDWDASRVYLGDFDGDGKTDLVSYYGGISVAQSFITFLSNGDGSFRKRFGSTGSNSDWNADRTWVGDVDGDGKADLLSYWGGISVAQSFITFRPSATPTDALTTLGNGRGGTTNVSYSPSSTWANTYLPSGMVFPTVRSTTVLDGRGASSTTSYSYAGGLWSDVERRYLGFRKVTSVVDAAGNYTETYYHQHVGCISKPEVTYYRNAQGAIFKYSTFGYTESATAPYTSLMTDRWEYECNLGTTCRRTLLQVGYDQYGNGSTTYEWGDYDVAGDERTTVRAAVPNTTAYIVGLAAYENVYAGIGTGGALLKQSLHHYDGNATYAAAPIKGQVTARAHWNSQTGGYVWTTYGYDAWGNQTSETDALGRTRTWAYDPLDHVRELQRCNALGQCSSKTWLGAFDVIASETDANGYLTTYTHDALMRPVKTTQANGTSETLAYLDWGNASLQRVRRTLSDGSADGLWTETWEDGAGRVWRTTKKGGQTQDLQFLDASARLWKRSQWYGAGETPQFQTMAYDGLGRLRTVTNPDGTSGSIVYGIGYTATYDELGNERVVWTDAYGATKTVRDKNGSTYVFTTYERDLLGNLTKVTDGLGNVTTATWDSLGRKLSGCDPDTGCSSYQYDAAGQLVWRKDGKGQVTTTSYDLGGRPRQRTRADGVVTTWSYDEPGHGASKGRFTTVFDSSGSESRSYDSAGNVTSTTKCIGGTCATTSYGYDLMGRPSAITYPNGEVVTYGYDAAGRVTSIPGYVGAIAYNGRGQITSIAYANGTTASYGYSPTRTWLSTSSVVGPLGTLYAMSYGYDAAARITSTTSSTNALSNLQFAYDGLGRLTTVAGSQTQSFTYDAIGRITSTSSLGAYAYDDPSHVHAVTAAGDYAYGYDANGNQLTGAGRALSWDADDQLIGVAASGKSVTYAYDHAGQRVSRSSSTSGTTRYFSRLAEQTGSAWTNNVYAGELLIAKNQGGMKRWYHADQLGSTRLITDAQGQAVQRYDYAAYGAIVGATGATGNTRTFGGHELEVDSGLTFMRARFYDALLGRFVSADTLVPDVNNTQAFDRYAFAYGNPIVNADPSGHVPVVAAAVTAISVGAATQFTGTLFVMSVIGAATTTVGYFANDPTLMSVGSVLLGAASGGAFGAGFLGAGAGSTSAAVWGGSIAALTSPVSPLSPGLKQAIGWAYAAQSIVHGYSRVDESIDEAARNAKLSEADLAKVESTRNARLDQLAKPENAALKAAYDDVMSGRTELTVSQLRYGRAVEIITGQKISALEAIALNPTGGLVGPGNGVLAQVLDPTTGWIPGVRIHAVVHDASGWLGSVARDTHTIGGLGVGPGYFYAGFNLFGLEKANMVGGQLEGIARYGGASVQSLFGRLF
ncbi:MAG: VCBS repeat-containing protein [Deltaproteobacteria bacterium]|nr:VCBS repeat-containing protein [Deltaproteobacteria bacterium]